MRADDVIKIALAEVGYREKASNASLDAPASNPGTANWTKYARDLAAAGYYNGNKNGYAWCDVFVDWCFYMAAGKNAAEAQKAECQTGTLGASCYYSKEYYKNQGRCDRKPKVGDQIFFTSGGTISHTGIVTAVNGSTVTTIEGNSGDAVKTHTYNLSSSYVDSFGHPKYDGEAEKQAPAPPVKDTDCYGSSLTVTLNTLKRGHKGPMVKTVQRIIYARGINKNIDVDGEFGPITETGVKALQKQLFPNEPDEQDGIVGQKTWTAILKKLN